MGGANRAPAATKLPAGQKRRPNGAEAAPAAFVSFADRYAAARPLQFEVAVEKGNHNVFRYPAKFHPPIARKLLELFSSPGQTVLDPFCGSGTLLVEGAILGRNGVGTDVDPLAVLVARAKTSLSDFVSIAAAAEAFQLWLEKQRTEDSARWGSFKDDIDQTSFEAFRTELGSWIPPLPRIEHWFRRRVVIQLAKIRREIALSAKSEGAQFLWLCFASIIRGSSNADPVPVSGLEVTSHMLAKEKAGRSVDPWRLMARSVGKSLAATKEFIDRRGDVVCAVQEGDARFLDQKMVGCVDAVITSPPYLTAVDYYRRHTLEMYWLGLTTGPERRLQLMPRYIGRDRLGSKYLAEIGTAGTVVAENWLPRFSKISPERERAFRHYCDGMARSLQGMLKVVSADGPIVIVAGDVRFCGVQVSMLELMKDLAGDRLMIADHLWYPIKNRYMSYARNNEANIAADHVLVFKGR